MLGSADVGGWGPLLGDEAGGGPDRHTEVWCQVHGFGEPSSAAGRKMGKSHLNEVPWRLSSLASREHAGMCVEHQLRYSLLPRQGADFFFFNYFMRERGRLPAGSLTWDLGLVLGLQDQALGLRRC